eukprot:m.750592 g.750592  ORF g.750592 m.750592 type:complete len:400 (-) comp23161_c0_seq4:2126-3325(-)
MRCRHLRRFLALFGCFALRCFPLPFPRGLIRLLWRFSSFRSFLYYTANTWLGSFSLFWGLLCGAINCLLWSFRSFRRLLHGPVTRRQRSFLARCLVALWRLWFDSCRRGCNVRGLDVLLGGFAALWSLDAGFRGLCLSGGGRPTRLCVRSRDLLWRLLAFWCLCSRRYSGRCLLGRSRRSLGFFSTACGFLRRLGGCGSVCVGLWSRSRLLLWCCRRLCCSGSIVWFLGGFLPLLRARESRLACVGRCLAFLVNLWLLARLGILSIRGFLCTAFFGWLYATFAPLGCFCGCLGTVLRHLRVFVSRIHGLFALAQFFELGDEKSVHVVEMRVEPTGKLHRGMKPRLSVAHKTGFAKGDGGVNELDVATLECIVQHRLVLFHHDGARRVHNVPTRRRRRVH